MPRLDLNLLRPLATLLETTSVSQSAEVLQSSQPVMSQALAKLRTHFDDPLLVRDGKAYVRTPLAEALLPLVIDALARIDLAEDVKSGFDGGSSTRTFVIAASDYAAATILTPFRRILSVEAPGVGVEVITTSGTRAHRLDFAKCDLVIGATGYSLPGRSATLFTDEFVAVLDAQNPILRSAQIDIRDIATLPNATGYFGDQVATPVDRVFEELGITRTIAAQVSGLLALPLLVEGSDLVAFVPRLLARRAQRGTDLVTLEMPAGARVQLVEAMYWPAIRESDSASAWLRSVLHRACLDIAQPRESSAREMTNRSDQRTGTVG